MNSEKISFYRINHNLQETEKISVVDVIYKIILKYLTEHSKKSNSTKECYARKYAEHCSTKKISVGGDFPIKENDFSAINTLFPELFKIPFPPPEKAKFTFIDLFSGIGGFHQAMHQLGGKCLLSSEIDKFAIDTYLDNYGIDSNRDITKIKDDDFPKHDVLCAGFPCLAFSKAGKQKSVPTISFWKTCATFFRTTAETHGASFRTH